MIMLDDRATLLCLSLASAVTRKCSWQQDVRTHVCVTPVRTLAGARDSRLGLHVCCSLFMSPAEMDDEYAATLADQGHLAGLYKCEVQDLVFNKADVQHGRWLNYAVGIRGTFSQEEHDALWPNEVCCSVRVHAVHGR